MLGMADLQANDVAAPYCTGGPYAQRRIFSRVILCGSHDASILANAVARGLVKPDDLQGARGKNFIDSQVLCA